MVTEVSVDDTVMTDRDGCLEMNSFHCWHFTVTPLVFKSSIRLVVIGFNVHENGVMLFVRVDSFCMKEGNSIWAESTGSCLDFWSAFTLLHDRRGSALHTGVKSLRPHLSDIFLLLFRITSPPLAFFSFCLKMKKEKHDFFFFVIFDFIWNFFCYFSSYCRVLCFRIQLYTGLLELHLIITCCWYATGEWLSL